MTIQEELENAHDGAGTPDSILGLTFAVTALANHLRLLEAQSLNIIDIPGIRGRLSRRPSSGLRNSRAPLSGGYSAAVS